MNLLIEQLKKIKKAKTADKPAASAKAEGIGAAEAKNRTQSDAVHKEGALEDDALDHVAGGIGAVESYIPQEGDSVIYHPTMQEGCVRKVDSRHFFGTGAGVTNRSVVSVTPGYEVEFSNGTSVWAKREQLSRAETGAGISF